MWMPYQKGRCIYKVDAPYTTLNKGITPNDVSSSPGITPTLIVRQSGYNAWKKPYIAVFEAVNDNVPSVVNVERIIMKPDNAVGVCVELSNERTDYIISNTDGENSCFDDKDLVMKGVFATVSEKKGEVIQALLLKGTMLEKGKISIKSDESNSVFVYLRNGKWFYSSTGKAYICIDNKKYVVEKAFDKLLKL